MKHSKERKFWGLSLLFLLALVILAVLWHGNNVGPGADEAVDPILSVAPSDDLLRLHDSYFRTETNDLRIPSNSFLRTN